MYRMLDQEHAKCELLTISLFQCPTRAQNFW
jgi:hypothetical protein